MEVDAVFDILVWYMRHQSHMDRTSTYPWTMSVQELLEHRSLSHYCLGHLNRRTFSQRALCMSFLLKSQERSTMKTKSFIINSIRKFCWIHLDLHRPKVFRHDFVVQGRQSTVQLMVEGDKNQLHP